MTDSDMVAATIDRENHTVLVVDDAPATRYATARVLRAAGFNTAEATNGREALALAAGGHVSAVILDVHLPDIDGFEVARRLRAMPRTTIMPVIHLSAMYVENKHKVAGLGSGADAYLTHPAEPSILVATVQALVRARTAEDEVHRSEAKFRAIYTQAESGIALIDAAGRVVDANPAMLRMLGRSEDAVVGRSMSEFALPGREPGLHLRTHAAELQSPLQREAFSIRRPDGGEVHLEWSISAEIEPGLRVGVVTNNSERMALEAQRQALLEREQAARFAAERHSRTKDDFIAVLSHELRNPLSAMLMGVHVLLRRGVSPDVATGLAIIERNAKIQARIISDILDVSRLNSGKLALDRDMADPAAIAATTLDGMQAAIEERRLKMVVDLDGAHAPVCLDPTRFQQVLWNIISNAVKFSLPGGEIRVRLTRDQATLRLVVQDFGRGIEPHFLGVMFDKFAQDVSPENRAHGGLGLGMAIVKQLVELHGGTVRAESEGIGRGTTVTVELPAVGMSLRPEDDARDAAADGAADGASDLNGVKCLIVEDDVAAGEMLSLILRDRGAVVAVATEYESALAAFERERPVIVVSDIGLPGRDGYELMRELRRRESATGARRIGAIALTAFGRPEDQAMALAAGFDLHISKPFTPHRLVSAMCRLSRQR